ncbi:cytochrome c nitrite reductase small subunit [Hwangdonia lutea]|uniref:Cytochrome c nitrite reductase small subunit n=1 Tax=Hwangdonia lutea TaxID=3075823 RepID=A0AA97HQY4_9FLAO|nr:cytochrome c nitrite reductase small subunit [Hwangdonia sp. SCSIO 19198]WOD43228.1 cytochrome c nitrite reductase small subunit [Hwangdonia sp. SCSIO 19198]
MSLNKKILPPKTSRWRTTAVFFIAVIIGLGLFMARESKIYSYMSDSPQACVNCHVMTPVYNSWMHSSHREWANCNDCHVPHDNVFNKYYFKAKDGLYHASVFTARAEPDVIKTKEASQEVVQNNCIRCHVQQVTQVKYDGWIEGHKENRTGRQCWSCHKNVPHGTVRGLTTIKYNIAPIPTDPEGLVIPAWMDKQIRDD